jgi:hypothetical protein
MKARPPHPIGIVPEWLDVETAGWPLRQALVTLAQELISNAARQGDDPWLLVDVDGNERWEHGTVLPNGRSPGLMPHAVRPWWDTADIHAPALLCNLISGRVIAFGDPDITGAQPHWIARRQWQQLTFDSDNAAAPITGAGAVFWNVRVMDADEYHGLASAMAEPEVKQGADVARGQPAKDPGGRPKHNTYEAFVAELVRLADSNDGLPKSRRELRAAMWDYLSRTFANGLPAESTFDSWLVKLVPHVR